MSVCACRAIWAFIKAWLGSSDAGKKSDPILVIRRSCGDIGRKRPEWGLTSHFGLGAGRFVVLPFGLRCLLDIDSISWMVRRRRAFQHAKDEIGIDRELHFTIHTESLA